MTRQNVIVTGSLPLWNGLDLSGRERCATGSAASNRRGTCWVTPRPGRAPCTQRRLSQHLRWRDAWRRLLISRPKDTQLRGTGPGTLPVPQDLQAHPKENHQAQSSAAFIVALVDFFFHHQKGLETWVHFQVLHSQRFHIFVVQYHVLLS